VYTKITPGDTEIKLIDRMVIMDFFEVVRTRQSTRAFTSQPLEPEKLQQLLDAINRAPSAGNLQAYEIFAVTRRESLDAMVAAARLKTRGQDYIAQAPIALVFCANPARSTPRFGSRGETLYCVQDATIACAYAQLAATALSLATVWIGSFDEAAVRQAIGVGDDLRPIVILPIGYAAETPDKSVRRPVTDLVHRVE
jgi:nitroreductase